jgi:FtsP/CotA-like multicopper oxidase with cupredoxin domain
MNHDTIKNGAAMTANETIIRRRTRRTKRGTWLGVAGLCATLVSIVPISGSGHAAGLPESEGLQCTDGVLAAGHRSFTVTADDGYTTEPDGNSIYGWGFGGAGVFQLPGAVLCVNQGEIVDITLVNKLPVATSIQFPGQADVTSGGLPVGPVSNGAGDLLALAPEAPAGGAVAYSFTATSAGTYLYESGSDPQLQVQMGLFGAIVVRPSGVIITPADILAIPADSPGSPGGMSTNAGLGMTGPQATAALANAACAYASLTVAGKCDPLAIYDKRRENILMLSEIDPGLHSFIEQNLSTPAKLSWNAYTGAYEAHYFMINGRSMPDTLAPNNAPWMPSQPYGAMAHVQPWDPHKDALDAMLRYVGVGVTGYDFHPHSNHEHVIAQDGALLNGGVGHDSTEEKFNIMVAPGSTVDATFRWTNEEGYLDTAGHRVPVAFPQGLNLTEGDFWSGSPYLGESGVLNPGILTKTQCGEYYHVAHSHDLTQATNYGITFGGMLTLIKVEPPADVQGHTIGDLTFPLCK